MTTQKQRENNIRQIPAVETSGWLLGWVTQAQLIESLNPLPMLEELEALKTLNETQAERLSQANFQLQHTHYVLRREADGRQQLALALQQANQRLEAQVGDRATELVRTDEILSLEVQNRQHAQHELEQFFTVTLSMLCIAGIDGYFKRLNPAFSQVLGYSDEELMAQPFVDFVHPDDLTATLTELKRLADGETTISFENRYRCKDGSYRWLDWNAIASLAEGAIYASARDITQQRQIELALKHQQQQGRLVGDITRRIREPLEIKEILRRSVSEVQAILKCDRVIVIEREGDSSGQVIEESTLPGIEPLLLNQAVTNLTFSAMSDARGPQVCVVEDLTQHPCMLCSRHFLKQFQIRASLEISIYVKNQPWGLLVASQNELAREWQPFEIGLMEQLADQMSIAVSQAQLLSNLEALVAQRTMQLSQTNGRLQKEIQEKVSTESALRESRQQLRLITDALPVLICYIDADQRYRFNNKTHTDWFGHSVEAIEGRLVREIVGDHYYQQAQPYIEKALSGQAVHYESTVTISDNKIRDLATTYIPDAEVNGKVRGFFGLIDDISDRKANERIQNEFISMVSHELRTPLTSIHGSLKLMSMMQRQNNSPKEKELVAIALKSTGRLSRLINDVLDLERIESSRLGLIRQDCDLGALMMQAAQSMESMACELDVRLVVEPTDITISLDSDRIIQTLTNLLSNAIKFSPPDSDIMLSATQRTQDILICVEDSGPGIPVDKLEIIFERFQQVDSKASRQLGGTGLGLAICKQIVQQHGGTIWVESELGKGCIFCFALPKS